MWAEEGGAGGLDDALDGGVAAMAGFSRAVVGGDAEFFAGDDGAGHGVFGVGAGGGLGKDFLDGGVERCDFFSRDYVGGRGGVDAGVPERFAGVDVADAGDAGLVEEGGLDGGSGLGEDLLEDLLGEGGFEGLGAEGVFEGFDFLVVDEDDFAEGAGVVEDDDAVVGEAEPDAGGVGAEAVIGQDVEVAGHAEVDVEVEGFVEEDEDVFGAAADGGDGGTVDGFEIGGEVGSDDAGAFDFDGVDGGVKDGVAEAADDGLDFGEFGHGLILC